jgi:hypothetical protein
MPTRVIRKYGRRARPKVAGSRSWPARGLVGSHFGCSGPQRLSHPAPAQERRAAW